MKKFLTFVCLSISLLFSACSENKLEQVTLSGQTMGTTYTIKYLQDSSKTFPSPVDMKKQIDARLHAVNNQMSTYIPESEISQFNRLNNDSMTMPISSDFAKVVAEAIRLNKMTKGALDVTVGPLVNMWGFGPDKTAQVRPTSEQIQYAREIVGIDKISLTLGATAEGAVLGKTKAQVYLDLSSIAKGFGVDNIADYLEKTGISDYLVEIGGELRAKGKNSNQQIWQVGIERPELAQAQHVQMVVPLNNLSMATSGNYRNFHIDEQGQRLSHIIDPNSFEPIKHQLASITVIHPSAMTADGLATGLFVLGENKALDIAEKEGLAVFLIIKTSQGFITKMSSAFKKMLNER